MALKWVRLSRYLRDAYPEGDGPHPRTVRKAIDRGEIAGKRSQGRTGHYYVLIDPATGIEHREIKCKSPIAERILQRIAR